MHSRLCFDFKTCCIKGDAIHNISLWIVMNSFCGMEVNLFSYDN